MDACVQCNDIDASLELFEAAGDESRAAPWVQKPASVDLKCVRESRHAFLFPTPLFCRCQHSIRLAFA